MGKTMERSTMLLVGKSTISTGPFSSSRSVRNYHRLIPNKYSMWGLCPIIRGQVIEVPKFFQDATIIMFFAHHPNNIQPGWWFQTWLDYFPFHIWDVILPIFPNSMIFQDGYCTTNQRSSSQQYPTIGLKFDWNLPLWIVKYSEIRSPNNIQEFDKIDKW